MGIDIDNLKPGTKVKVLGRVDRTTTEADQGIDGVLVWVPNPLSQMRGDKEISVALPPEAVELAEEPVAESILAKLIAIAVTNEEDPGVAHITVDLTGADAIELWYGEDHELELDEHEHALLDFLRSRLPEQG